MDSSSTHISERTVDEVVGVLGTRVPLSRQGEFEAGW